MKLGDIIKQYRTEKNLSMDDFAKTAGLSKAYISILERNYNPSTKKPVVPSLTTLTAVSAAMNLDFNELINLLDPEQQVNVSFPQRESHTEAMELSNEEIKLLEAYRKASNERKKLANIALKYEMPD